MELDGPSVQLQNILASVIPDGMLLYVTHASYEPGTSPLSTWVPIRAHADERAADKGEELAQSSTATGNGPLDIFDR